MRDGPGAGSATAAGHRGLIVRRVRILLLGVFGAWAAFAWLVVPALIRSAYRGESIGFLNRLITGQGSNPVQSYLDSWSRLSGYLTIALLGLLLVAYLVFALELWRHPGRWTARLLQREEALKGQPPRLQPAGYSLVFVWCGLTIGLWEMLYLSKKMLLGEWLAVHMATSVTSVWMAPLGYVLIFGLVGALLFAVAYVRPRWLTLKWVVVAGIFVAVFSGGRSTASRLELWGLIPVAAGVAMLSGRLAAAYSERCLRFVRRSVPAALILIAVIALGIEVEKRVTEHRALSRLPTVNAPAPNVLLIILDTVRSKSVSVYGYTRPTTPNLERMAERGIVFDRAVASAPWTLPTHATVFTGRHQHELSVNWTKPLDATFPTLAEVFRQRGYHTAGFVGNFYYGGPQFGLDRGFIHYEHKPVTFAGIISSGWLGRELLMKMKSAIGDHQDLVRKTAADVNQEFLNWHDAADSSRPFFAFLNYFDAHSPYLPPKPFDQHFGDESPRYWLKDEGEEYTPEELSDLTEAYDNSIAYLDDQLGLLFDELERRGILENTLLLVTSDHGEQFGEHRLMYHSNSLYMPLLHVPLLVSFPAGLPSGIRVEEPVSLRDIAATILDIVCVSDSPLPGYSMAGSWSGGPGVTDGDDPVVLSEITHNRRIPDWMPAAYGPMQSLVVGRLHYIRRGDGAEELYDWIADPDERTDLAATDAVPTEDVRSDLDVIRARLYALLQSSSAGASGGSSSR